MGHCPLGAGGTGLWGPCPPMLLWLVPAPSSLAGLPPMGSAVLAATCWEERLGKPKGNLCNEGADWQGCGTWSWDLQAAKPHCSAPGRGVCPAPTPPLSPRTWPPPGQGGPQTASEQGPTCGHACCGAVRGLCSPRGCSGSGVPVLQCSPPWGAHPGGAAMQTHALVIPVTSTKSDADKYPLQGPQGMADIYFSLWLS